MECKYLKVIYTYTLHDTTDVHCLDRQSGLLQQ